MITKLLKFITISVVLFVVFFIVSSGVLAQTNPSKEFQGDTGGPSTADESLEPVKINENESNDVINKEFKEENNLTEKAENREQSAGIIGDDMQKSFQKFKFLSIASFILAVIAIICCGYNFLVRKRG